MATDNFNGMTGGFSSNTTEAYGTGSYTSTLQYTASWCPNCGRRRAPDGRCSDCDPWWTMPVVQYSAGLGVMVALLLLGGIALFQPHNSSSIVSVQPGNPGVVPSFRGGSPGASLGYAPYVPPVYVAPQLPSVNMSATLAPSTQELQLRAIEQLRQTTAYTDSVVEQRRQEQWQAVRAAYQGGYATGGNFSIRSSQEAVY